MKRIYNNRSLMLLADNMLLVNLRFTKGYIKNECLKIEYYPREKDAQSICIYLSAYPTDSDKEYLELLFSDDNSKVKIEDVDMGENGHYRVWIPGVVINL